MSESIESFRTQLLKSDPTSIQKYKKEFISSHDYASFSEFINDKMRNGYERITRMELAKRLGYDENEQKKKAEILKKIINTPGWTTIRNRIIMICVALYLSPTDANYALRLYKMVPLDKNDFRDMIIITGLYEQASLAEINSWLIKANCDPLQFDKDPVSDISGVISIAKTNFNELSPVFFICKTGFSNDISSQYDLRNYNLEASIIISDKKNNTCYKLSCGGEGSYYVYDEEDIIGGELEYDHCFGFPEYYKRLEACPQKFIPYFIKLQDAHRQKTKELIDVVDDTRNYKERFSLMIKDHSFLFFVETFDYDYPEEPHYFQMKMYRGKYRMTITQRSLFLRTHLPDLYKTYYSEKKEISINEEYSSISEIEKKYKNNKYQLRKITEMYKYLSDKLMDFSNQIQKGEKIVFPATDCFDDFQDLLSQYELEKYWSWNSVEQDGYQFLEPASDEIDLTINGTDYHLSLDFIKRAASLAILTQKDLLYYSHHKLGLDALFS